VPPLGNRNGDGASDKPLAEVIAEWERSSRTLRAAMQDLWVTLGVD
jgi:hypothetical protein